MSDYSTTNISSKLLLEIKEAIENIKGWGSVEIFVQDSEVVQITERNIKKTNNNNNSSSNIVQKKIRN